MGSTLIINPTSPLPGSGLINQKEMNRSTGGYICQRMQAIALTAMALHNIARFTINYGEEATCAATTILAGLGNIYSGNWVMGAGLAAVGVKRIYGIMCERKTDVTSLLQDASAGIDMIKTLDEANKKSFEHMNANLNLVSQNVQDLEQRLKEIDHLATHGSKKLQRKKAEVGQLYKASDALFKEAQSVLNQSKEQIGQSSEQFAQALSNIQELVELAQKEEGDFKEKVNQFALLSNQVYGECLMAKEKLDSGNQALDQGLKLLTEALTKYNKATFEAGKAFQQAQSKLEKIQSRTKIEQSCQTKIAEVKNEVADIQQRNKEMRQIADEVQADFEEAEKKMGVKFGLESLIFGGGLGAFTGAVLSGGLAAGAGAVAGTVAYHNRQPIGNLLLGKNPEPEVAKPTLTNPVTYQFNPVSTGFWGRFKENRPSRTVGKLAIDLGEGQVMSFSFDLNAKHKIAKKDLKNLYQQLAKKLDEDAQKNPTQLKQNAQFCLTILNKLETTMIDRGSKHRPCNGFIYNNNPYFADFKRKATRLVG